MKKPTGIKRTKGNPKKGDPGSPAAQKNEAKGARTVKAPKPSAKPTVVDAPKEKRIRGTFAMPARDHALIAELKSMAKSAGRAAKKNELLRAGLRALIAMPDQALVSALDALAPREAKSAKTTKRPKGAKRAGKD